MRELASMSPRAVRGRTRFAQVARPNPIPRPGMLATVRDRRGTVTAVDPFDGESGRLHLVHLDYTKLHYYPETGSLYVECSEKPGGETREVSDAPDGSRARMNIPPLHP